jgi:hypothetical protein
MAAAHKIPSVETFDQILGDDRSSNAGPLWEKWVKRFENYLCAVNITADGRKRAMLLHLVGPRTFDEFDTLPETGTDYATAKAKLQNFFKPKVNVEFEKIQFRMMRQKGTIDQYHTRLRQAAATCDFADNDCEIKTQLIQTMRDSKVRKKALNTNMTLEQILVEARSNELTRVQNVEIENQLGASSKSTPRLSVNAIAATPRQKLKCFNCGGQYPHPGGIESCPARGKTCETCGKTNHFTKLCKSKGKIQPKKSSWKKGKQKKDKKKVNALSGAYVYDDSNSDSDEEAYLFTVRNSHTTNKPPKFLISVNNRDIVMIADSAATCTILDEATYRDKFKDIVLTPTKQNIQPYSKEAIQPLGKFNADITCKSKSVNDSVFVLPGGAGCLLSIKTSQALGLITVAEHTVNAMSVADKFIIENPTLAQGIGKQNGKSYKLHIDRSQPPIVQKVRRLPFHTRKKVGKEINRLLEADIIEKATGPTTWVSPIVVVPKKDSENIRICVDMKVANKAIVRERHPTPTIDDLQDRLNGCTVFSKIDLRQGYLQLELDAESRDITTFATHMGLFRSKRLSFGITSASEIFQKAVEETISDINEAMNISDDIIVGGLGQEDHDKALIRTLVALLENGFTINLPKCLFSKPELHFFGMKFSKDGMQPDSTKVDAILQMAPPSSVPEVLSLLGMLNYNSRFIPNYSTLTSPIRKLTQKNYDFQWGSEQQEAWQKLVDCLAKKPVLSYFDVNQETEIFVDASPVGLGGILVQRDKDNKIKIVAYGSRSLTETEQRYSQLEREALGVVWACEHFHIYIYGKPVIVHTDHKPLLGIFGKPRAHLPMRLERWSLRLQPYTPEIRYQKGSDNPADYLSRHPLPARQTSSKEEQMAEDYVNYISSQAVPKAMSKQEILEASRDDPTMQVVTKLIVSGKWYLVDNPMLWANNVDLDSLKSYQRFNQVLSLTSDGLILRKNRIAVPHSLQKRIIELAHEGHQGVNRTKSLLREKVWFPQIDSMVESRILNCIPCQATYDPKQREPLLMTELPSRPWEKVSMDFYGPLPSGHSLLVTKDDYSRFPEVDILASQSASATIPALDKLFASRGVPDVVRTDNGTPFQSADFKAFSEELGFTHRKITPYWPEANGGAERFMRTMGKTVKCAQIQGKPWRKELNKFLRNYRATPHSVTGVAPATLLNGQPLKTKLPEVFPAVEDKVVRDKDKMAKRKMKAYAESRRNIKKSDISIGDKVLMKEVRNQGKLVPKFQPDPFEVIERKGPMVIVKRGEEVKARNIQHFKRIGSQPDLHNSSNETMETEMSDMPKPSARTEPDASVLPGNISCSQNSSSNTSQTSTSTSVAERPRRPSKLPKKLSDYVVNAPNLNR